MSHSKIVITGGTGFIGSFLKDKFIQQGYEVMIISRSKESINWDDEQGIIKALEGAKMVINLAGKSVDCRYNEKNKAEIFSSRLETTKIIGNAILKCKTPPELWINSSTATIYRHAEDRPMTEEKGEIGKGFSVEVAKSWEKTFFDFNLSNTRQIALRMAIVLGKNGGVITPFVNLVRFGLGGKQGNGKQMFSWIHIDDLYRIIHFLSVNKEYKGVFNCSAPNPIDNNTLMKTFRNEMKAKIGLPSPKLLLEIGAFFIRTETELILKSRWVIPEKLTDLGFSFQFPKIEECLKDILTN